MYVCPKCKLYFKQSNTLIWHLREIHALSDQLDFPLICSQDGCPRTYHCINSFSKHIKREHKITQADEDQPHQTPMEMTAHEEAVEISTMEDDIVADAIVEPESSVARPKGATASFFANMYSGSNFCLADADA